MFNIHSQSRSRVVESLGHERMSRIAENQSLAVERMHEANKDDAMAALDRVKALKELEGMDIEHLGKLIAVLQAFKNQESQTAEQGVSQVQNVLNSI